MPDATRPFPPAAIAALSNGNNIVREAWGVDLKDAKDAVEAYVTAQPARAADRDRGLRFPARGKLLMAAGQIQTHHSNYDQQHGDGAQ